MNQDIKLFFKKYIIFTSPFIIFLIIFLLIDPFRVWFDYENYYKNNFIEPNRGLVCLKLFKRNINTIHYNSFIFGNSRSHVYKTNQWKKYLDKEAVEFHFGVSGDGIFGIRNKLIYLEKNNVKIKNALLIIDNDCMTTTKNINLYFLISPPELSGESYYSFYKLFFIANINPSFMFAYFDYKIFHTYRNYMKSFFNEYIYDHILNTKTGDLYNMQDRLILENKNAYYKKMTEKGVFNRENIKYITKSITPEEINILEEIANILRRNHTKYKIVISPLYNQIPLDKNRLSLLNHLFGKNNVYNFSGVNKFTSSKYNYYESSHYRPNVANEIMREIY